ncbi:MAG: hypothetical protein C5B49_11135 [Bdellovibrio sp.]|nr:MAG: hypothetical protein C5B49_11135 [Bdellovibrio sp.]
MQRICITDGPVATAISPSAAKKHHLSVEFDGKVQIIGEVQPIGQNKNYRRVANKQQEDKPRAAYVVQDERGHQATVDEKDIDASIVQGVEFHCEPQVPVDPNMREYNKRPSKWKGQI